MMRRFNQLTRAPTARADGGAMGVFELTFLCETPSGFFCVGRVLPRVRSRTRDPGLGCETASRLVCITDIVPQGCARGLTAPG
jgi:hypothetical protein